MLVKQILSFFSTSNSYSIAREELHDIRNYQSGDGLRDINWKKTATFDSLMTNTFDDENKIAWCVVFVINQNMKKWLYKSTVKRHKEFIEQISTSARKAEVGTIRTKILSKPPRGSDYQLEKQVVISDFFWDSSALRDFLQACQKWVARGIIPQLYTQTGVFFHPLLIKYPHYFFSQDLT